MNYGVLLAGGSGTRIKSINISKQYFEIDNIPIIIYTLNRLLDVKKFDYIYIAVANGYVNYMNTLLDKYVSEAERQCITVLEGGKERIDSLHNVIKKIIELNAVNDDDVIVVHDAVRPFVSAKILENSIDGARKYGATVAAVPVSDTMLNSAEGEFVDYIPKRKELYKGQAPDSFRLKTLIELENNLTEEQKKQITGSSQICTMNNYPIKMIAGDDINFKITTDADLEMAKVLILSRKKK